MKAYIFPGQGAQFVGMGSDLYEHHELAKALFEEANDILGFRITEVMFSGSIDELKQTKITQPAIFLHAVILSKLLGNTFRPDMVAGHSLGEFSALVAVGAISFEDGLSLVSQRAMAMQSACEAQASTMAAVIGLDDETVDKICSEFVNEVVVPANYNCPGQVVISGSFKGVETACERLKKAGARRAILLNVGGAFHSPLMEPARQALEKAIRETKIQTPVCPVYQNVSAMPVTDPDQIKVNLSAQLTASVRWSQSMKKMIADGADEFIEVGPGKVLQGLVRKVDRQIVARSAEV